MRKDGQGDGNAIVRYEHLVIRDLVLLPLPLTKAEGAKCDGRIVDHVVLKYNPVTTYEKGCSLATDEIDIAATPIEIPTSAHRKLHGYWNARVEEALDSHFSGLCCFEVRELATLAPSHLRRGIANKLLAWIFLVSRRIDVSVVLAATPLGYPFYLQLGFC
ncbi:hypothetical protein A1O1_03396 [Capronia coronata CBS 617.96]|uniref:N-acetyltransferase domain-containing protein n=1 Tax=Capronia coronata CBS 617.96 TaxID=1182541 RepID=W9YBR2_9EURO|nr:uncharacterized protein A1O1_03396 [Capronia coronata CBS 617.96]EXJ90297.1 hypothetical protein A1O1_03396 [Capronia coronata CBS 617.96]